MKKFAACFFLSVFLFSSSSFVFSQKRSFLRRGLSSFSVFVLVSQIENVMQPPGTFSEYLVFKDLKNEESNKYLNLGVGVLYPAGMFLPIFGGVGERFYLYPRGVTLPLWLSAPPMSEFEKLLVNS